MRFAVDTGGTFTDLVVGNDEGDIRMYKSETTPDDPVQGVLDALALAARDLGLEPAALLAKGRLFVHGTTRAINAIVTGSTARTAFLATQGHPDILVIREGGRSDMFNFTEPFPDPYVPRALTYEVPERIGFDGSVITPLDERAVLAIIDQLKRQKVEALAVCLLWSIVNPRHEDRIGELIEEHLPGVPYTLSHRINPSLREYRRASSAAIDASLKPLMGSYLSGLERRLRQAGFPGRVLVVTTQGGAMDALAMAEAPIHSINSGPAMAPLAGRFYARQDSGLHDAIVADTGGTTFDVSLVRDGRIPWTRETWIGPVYRGHMTGFPAVDVRSIGAGGGSIAWVDEGGLLHVGPKSAGAVPGPVCYGKGGTEPTVTDACVVLGWIDPAFFLGGAMKLDRDKAADAITKKVARPLGLDLHQAAAAIMRVATENMVHAIEDITVNQGIDPRGAVLIGGGGAAGLNAVAIVRRLGCPQLIIPETGAALSAAGGLISDLRAEASTTYYTSTAGFDFAGVNKALAALEAKCKAFIAGPGAGSIEQVIEYTAEARYPSQIWEIETHLRKPRFDTPADVETLRQDFHKAHEQIFAIADLQSPVEIVGWRAAVRCRLREGERLTVVQPVDARAEMGSRKVFFAEHGMVEAAVIRFEAMNGTDAVAGPAIIESSFTTVVLDPGASATRRPSGSLVITPH
jgi:N-methylhydantoinase A